VRAFRDGTQSDEDGRSRSFPHTNKPPMPASTVYAAEKDARALPGSVLDLGWPSSLCLSHSGSFGKCSRTGELEDGTSPDDRKLPEGRSVHH